ncbi:hypothetical protein ACFOET_18330 [Parapedobacter deserti]|uniref:HEPN domain-containing protein n=1 Tax=Parapedobacter deserti TaxID=1912957 RepID=A0ABV7JNA0_9SPHI
MSIDQRISEADSLEAAGEFDKAIVHRKSFLAIETEFRFLFWYAASSIEASACLPFYVVKSFYRL